MNSRKSLIHISSIKKGYLTVRMSLLFLLASLALMNKIFVTFTMAQSIGVHPNVFLGFNPYLSPVFGYGLGLPYGAHGGYSSLKLPFISSSLIAPSAGVSANLLGKVHAKAFLKKFSYPFSMYPHISTIKNKIQLMKHPEYSFTPYGLDYGFGKHYGSAMVPNNPYKSAYGDYYNDSPITDKGHTLTQPLSQPPIGTSIHEQGLLAQPSVQNTEVFKTYAILKPLIKAGALLTTAALLGKKTIDNPPFTKLHPAGMIMSGKYE